MRIGWPGRVHNAHVLANSGLFAKGQSGTLFPKVSAFIQCISIRI